VKPIHPDAILETASETKMVLSFEEHKIIGSLGCPEAEIFVEHGKERPWSDWQLMKPLHILSRSDNDRSSIG